VTLTSDDFDLFGLPDVVSRRTGRPSTRAGKNLQREAHPDSFAAQGPAAQRIAMQWSVRINEAYQRLKDPLRRAAYLCELRGAPVNAETNTAMPADFLVEQMAWREALDEATTTAALDTLVGDVDAARKAALAAIERLLDVEGDADRAVQQVRALMFIERFALDVEARFEQLGQ
jgi:molecular chaperone HscB